MVLKPGYSVKRWVTLSLYHYLAQDQVLHCDSSTAGSEEEGMITSHAKHAK